MVKAEPKPRANCVIRPIRDDELLTVMEINRICLPENYSYSFFYTIYRSNSDAFLVAEVDKAIVGYVMCRVEWGISKIESLRLRKLGHIVSIAVLPEYRGRGIGRQLLERTLQVLRDVYSCDEAYLEVRVSNTAAINLYYSLGYKVVKVAKHYYIDGEDAYVMAMKI